MYAFLAATCEENGLAAIARNQLHRTNANVLLCIFAHIHKALDAPTIQAGGEAAIRQQVLFHRLGRARRLTGGNARALTCGHHDGLADGRHGRFTATRGHLRLFIAHFNRIIAIGQARRAVRSLHHDIERPLTAARRADANPAMFQVEGQAISFAAVTKTRHTRRGQQKRGVVIEGDGRQRILTLFIGVECQNGA